MGCLIVTWAGAISPDLRCKMLENSGEKFNMFSPSQCFFLSQQLTLKISFVVLGLNGD